MAGSLMPKASRRGRGHASRRPPMQEINVTPFVDVMLVLLVIFMVTAPLITQGVDIALPEVENQPITEDKNPVQIGIAKNGSVYIQDTVVRMDELAPRLMAIRKARPDTSILLRADSGVPYGKVMEVMSVLQSAGIVDVGLETQAPGTS